MLIVMIFHSWNLLPTVLGAQEQPGERPRVGVVLSGGGARGAAHVGVLRVLEEMRVPVDCIAGTSMGAIVGGLYAMGMPLDEIERITTQVDWQEIFTDEIPRRQEMYRNKSDTCPYIT
ncbi:MAG TPA: patatin-like phospholipase family protein, partial [Deltaproteobacteria bacterium]|nr:patatin-like phospholipase family protein [Deltaproteobacteria bacterium]